MMIIASTYSAEIQGYWTTVGWSLPALVLIILGFLWKERTYRRTALVIFALAISRVMLVDVAQLEAFYRMAAFLCLGVCLIAVSFLYSRFRKTIQQWL